MLRIGLSLSLVRETNQSSTTVLSKRQGIGKYLTSEIFSNTLTFSIKSCGDLTEFFLKVKKIVKFVEIISLVNYRVMENSSIVRNFPIHGP